MKEWLVAGTLYLLAVAGALVLAIFAAWWFSNDDDFERAWARSAAAFDQLSRTMGKQLLPAIRTATTAMERFVETWNGGKS